MQLTEILKMNQRQLQEAIANKYDCIWKKGGYVYVPGDIPIMLVAHLDTVHEEPVWEIYRSSNILYSPQGIGGDDRCGVYALMRIHSLSPCKPSLLFTCDEEIGGIGARLFAEDSRCLQVYYMIEIDRRGNREAIYYECHNREFEKIFERHGFIKCHGSFTDISILAPSFGCAAVNLSAGYHNEHTLEEYINTLQLQWTINAVTRIVQHDNGRYAYDTLAGRDMGGNP